MAASSTINFNAPVNTAVPLFGYLVTGFSAATNGQVSIIIDGNPTTFNVSAGMYYPLAINMGNGNTVLTKAGASGMVTCTKSGASVTGAQSIVGVGAKLKRAAVRAMANAPDILPVATGVTVTVSATNTATAATTNVIGLSSPNQFYFTGGFPTANNAGTNNRLYFPSENRAPDVGSMNGISTTGTNLSAWSYTASIQTESAIVAFQMLGFTTRSYRILVDGRYVAKVETAFTVNNGINFVIVDFSGVYLNRRITIEADSICGFFGVFVEPTAYVAKPADPERVTHLWSGDSYGEGYFASGAYFNNRTLAPTFGRLIGATDTRQVAVGGTGYLQAGTSRIIRSQIDDWMLTNADLSPADIDLITLASGYNDRGAVAAATITAAQVGAEAAFCVQKIRRLFPNAIINVLGPWAGQTGPDATIISIENEILSQVSALGLPNVWTTPVSTDLAPWQTGTGKNGATTGVGNGDRDLSSDGTHPSLTGYESLAQRAAIAYRGNLLKIQ